MTWLFCFLFCLFFHFKWWKEHRDEGLDFFDFYRGKNGVVGLLVMGGYTLWMVFCLIMFIIKF